MRADNGGSYMTAGEHYKCEHECHGVSEEQRKIRAWKSEKDVNGLAT